MPSAPLHIQPTGAAPADDFSGLERTEQLIVWTLRAIAIGHGECPTLRRMFGLTFGAGADDAFLGFFVTVRTLGWCGRRKLRLHVPGCMAVSPDERIILALFAEAQASLADGDESGVRARLAYLLDSRATEAVLLSLQTVASTLEASGCALPRPQPIMAAERPGATRLLH
ncbi:MAG: hypothetical protein WA840_07055 [Caulobacteraceae bacterium]